MLSMKVSGKNEKTDWPRFTHPAKSTRKRNRHSFSYNAQLVIGNGARVSLARIDLADRSQHDHMLAAAHVLLVHRHLVQQVLHAQLTRQRHGQMIS